MGSSSNLELSTPITGFAVDSTIKLINNKDNDAVSGNFAGLNEGDTLSILDGAGSRVPFRISYTGGDGNDVVLKVLRAAPTARVTQPTCSVATGTITVTSSKTGLTFSINGSTYTNASGVFSGVASGSYSVTAKSASGSISLATTVTVNAKPTSPVATASVATQTVCTGIAIAPIYITDANNLTGTTFSWTRTNGSSLTGMATSGTGTVISGSNGRLVNATTGPLVTVFNITAYSADGCRSSTTVTVTVNPKPSITAQPANTSKAIGETASFSITAAGLITSYQWQQSTNAGSTYSNITNAGIYSGANSSTLYLTGVTSAMNNYKYRCIATGQCSPAITSNAATLTVTNSNITRVVVAGASTPAAKDSVAKNTIAQAGVQVYPNPTLGQFNLGVNHFSVGKAAVKITDARGRILLVKEVLIGAATQVVSINIHNAIPGSYYIQVLQPDHTASMVLIKE